MRCATVAVTAIALLGIQGGGAAGGGDVPTIPERAHSLVEELRREWKAPGVSAAVGIDGRVVFAGGAGEADAEGTPVGRETRFRIASASKPISAVLMLRLAESDLLDLDAPLAEYLAWVPDHAGAITTRQVLAHTSGIRHYEPGETSHRAEHFASAREVLAPLLSEPLEFGPGTGYRYTTYGYTVLQAVAEAVTGQSFEDALEAYVLEPAGMVHTGLDRSGAPLDRAIGFDRGGEVPPDDVSFKYAGGGMVSTPTDLVRFCGALDDGRLLGSETRDSLLEPAFPDLDPEQSYGFAVEREIDTGLLRLWHPGRGNGFEAYLLCYPEERVAVAVLTNQDWTDPWKEVGRAAETLAKLFLPPIALYRTPPQVLVSQLEALTEAGRPEDAAHTYAAYRKEIEGRWDAGLEVHRLAERQTSKGNLRGAGALFEANAEAFPESWRTRLAQAEARLRLGNLAGAREAVVVAETLAPEQETITKLRARVDELAEPPRFSPGGEYTVALLETGLAEELLLELRVEGQERGLDGTAKMAEVGELPVLSIVAGGRRMFVVLSSRYGLLELDIVRGEAGILGQWHVAGDAGPLRGAGPGDGVE